MQRATNNIPWTINNKIKIIRDFAPVAMPTVDFNNKKDTIKYIIWNLYNRVYEATQSFIALLDNKRFYDSFLIAGHALETCAVLSYIKDNKTKSAQIKNYNKYIARSAVGRLLAILDMDKTNLSADSAWVNYAALFKIFYPAGAAIIKKEQQYEEIIKQINYCDGTNDEKIRLIKESFPHPDPKGYVKSFSKRLGNFDDGQFLKYYARYCDFKHCNLLSPGAISSDIDKNDVDYFIDLILGILMYLDKYKLLPVDEVPSLP
jgi:hypothetical protein